MTKRIFPVASRSFRWIAGAVRALYRRIEGSKLAVGLLVGLLTAVIVGRRDAFLRRDEVFRPNRAALIDDCLAFQDDIEGPLVRSTFGYVDYALDIQDVFGYEGKMTDVAVPPERIPAEKEEEVKWKIRKEQEPLFKEIEASRERRRKILELIENYTNDPRIEVEWRLVDTALGFIKGEDRFVSGLWMEKEAIDSGATSIVSWNRRNSIASVQKAQAQFCARYSMAFRVYFYQAFIRAHMKRLIQLILKEQAGTGSIIPSWLLPITNHRIPAITHAEVVNLIFADEERFRGDYLKPSAKEALIDY